MGFIQPCFIRKNTPKLMKNIEELGYKMNLTYSRNEQNLYICGGVYSSANFIDNFYLDCGTNEELFLALAALRDDSDKNQWFTDGKLWEKSNDELPSHYMQLEGHKATVEEIIKQFRKAMEK